MQKIHLIKILAWNQVQNNNGLPILTLRLWEKTKQWHGKYEKYQFYTQRRPKILSSHKSFEKYNELEMFCKKTILKNLATFTIKNMCSSPFFNKNLGLKTFKFIEKKLQNRCFPENIDKCLRTPVCRTSVNIWTFSCRNNITSYIRI